MQQADIIYKITIQIVILGTKNFISILTNKNYIKNYSYTAKPIIY